jgi:hypothetical protein
MVAINRNMVDIYIVANDTSASSLASTDIIKGEIKNYAKSGGDRDVESDPLFGGYVDKEKPLSQVELSFEIVPSIDSGDEVRWEALAYNQDPTGVYVMSGDIVNKAVYIQAYDSTQSTYKSWGFNNCNVTLLDFDHSADDNQTANMTLKFSPTDENGVSNFMAADTAVTSLPNWSSLTAD